MQREKLEHLITEGITSKKDDLKGGSKYKLWSVKMEQYQMSEPTGWMVTIADVCEKNQLYEIWC